MAKSKTDVQMIARLRREAPEVLEREVDFDALVVKVTAEFGCTGLNAKHHKRTRRIKKRAARSS
jgi:hypothetical protein